MEVAHARLSSLPRNFVVKYADDISFDYDSYLPIEDNPDTHAFFRTITRPNGRMQHLAILTRLLILEEQEGPADISDTNVSQFIEKGTTPTVSGTTPTKTPRRHGPHSPICRHSTACSATM